MAIEKQIIVRCIEMRLNCTNYFQASREAKAVSKYRGNLSG